MPLKRITEGIPAEAVVSRVGAAQNVLDVLVRNHRQGRAELFFIDETHAVGNFTDYSWRVEISNYPKKSYGH